ncbi:MAG: arginine--tRNA ligase [Candidatus Omnitrophica bacterium]|nr:arginine--tRNA ligase [Candidatus Omnitrophota bacterium]
MQDLRLPVREILWDTLKSLGLSSLCSKEDIELEFAPPEGFGDISTSLCLRIAKKARKNPKTFAVEFRQILARKISDSDLKDIIADIKAEGPGFLNFYLSQKYLYQFLITALEKKDFFVRKDIGKGKRVLFEFVSANPTGPLSVAHARQAAVGDTLANIFSFLGYEVTREYYLNDEGNQITILGNSLKARIEQLEGKTVEFPEKYYQGEYLIELARKIKKEKLVVSHYDEFAASSILEVIKKELIDFRVKFDSWYSQKALRLSGKIEEVLNWLKEKELVYEQDGAWWFKSTGFGDDKDRVVIKSDGSYTYLAPDIAYHRDKYQRGFSRLINFWGPDHHGYIGRLKAAVAALGYEPQTLDIVIVQLATISRDGKEIEMSTRKGQYITLREVLEEVGVDASRFFFLMRRTSSHLNFDLEIAKKQTPENPVYYIQYAHARIASILRQVKDFQKPTVQQLQLLKEKEEISLIKKMWQFPYILEVCHDTIDPYLITVYLQELAETFHKFYDRHRVLLEDRNLSYARIALISVTRHVLALGLSLTGVEAPEKM